MNILAIVEKKRPQTLIALLSAAILGWLALSSPKEQLLEPCAEVLEKPFSIVVRAVGELEAARSRIIASSLRGDSGKVIDLVKDGDNVKAGDVLVRLDPSPFEEKVEELKVRVREQEGLVESCQQLLLLDQAQADREEKQALFDLEAAEMELQKVKLGDGPLELSKMQVAMQKALAKFEELSGYAEDLQKLQEQGFLNIAEVVQAKKKLSEEKESYETAKSQYETFRDYVFPMQVRKAESLYRKAKVDLEETIKNNGFKVGKTQAMLAQSQATLEHLNLQLKGAYEELAATEICAPTPGMAVLREEYRSGQRRKPRIGDLVVKNQPILDLPDLNSMIVKTRVREIDLHKIALGKEAQVEVDAYPHLKLAGKVSSIGVLAVSDGGRSADEKYFEVVVAIEQSDYRLRPGMTSRVTILADQIEKSAVIPIQALFNENGEAVCFVKKGSSFEKRTVEAGACSEEYASIIAGVKLGEKVSLVQPLQPLQSQR